MSSEDATTSADPEKEALLDSPVDSDAIVPIPGEHALHRTMKNRHIAMIRCVSFTGFGIAF